MLEFWARRSSPTPTATSCIDPVTTAKRQPIVECDLSLIDTARTHWPFLRDRRIDAYGDLTKTVY